MNQNFKSDSNSEQLTDIYLTHHKNGNRLNEMLNKAMLPEKLGQLEEKMAGFQTLFKAEQKKYRESSKVLVKELRESVGKL